MAYGREVAVLCLLGLIASCTKAPQSEAHNALSGSESVRDWLNNTPAAAEETTAAARTQVPPVEDMIAGLVEKLEQNPDDRKGWELLARSYAFVGDFDQAEVASQRAVELGADADALGLATDGRSRPN